MSMSETFHVPSNSGFLFAPVLWSSFEQTPLTCKVKFSEGSSSRCQTPQAGELDVGLRILTPV